MCCKIHRFNKMFMSAKIGGSAEILPPSKMKSPLRNFVMSLVKFEILASRIFHSKPDISVYGQKQETSSSHDVNSFSSMAHYIRFACVNDDSHVLRVLFVTCSCFHNNVVLMLGFYRCSFVGTVTPLRRN